MRMLRSMLQGIDNISESTGMIVRWLAIAMMLIAGFAVVARYAFNAPAIWAPELSGMLFGPYFLLGGGYVLRHNAHVSLDTLYVRLRPRVRAILDVITYLLFFYFTSLILVYGFNYAWESVAKFEHSTSVWGPPIYPIKVIIPLAAALMLLQGIARYIRSFHMAITGKELI